MARMLIVLFVVLFVGVGSAQGQIVNVGDSDSVRLARVRVLMDQPAGSGSMLFGSGSVLTLEPERSGVRNQIRSTVGGGSAVRAWIGIGLMAFGAYGVYSIHERKSSDINEQALAGAFLAGGFFLWVW